MKKVLVFLVLVVLASCGQPDYVSINGYKTKVIPGITASDVTLNFTNKAFDLKKNITGDYSEWKCSKQYSSFEQIVIAVGNSPMNLTSISGTYLSYESELDKDLAKEFLGYLASTPYKGAQPQKAKDWLMANFEDGASSEIGGVQFSLSVADKVAILNIKAR